MTKLGILIDPDDTNANIVSKTLSKHINTIDIWVGCSSSTMKELLHVLSQGGVNPQDIFLFPGTIEQIEHHALFQRTFLPHPFPQTQISNHMVQQAQKITKYSENIVNMAYIILNTDCTAAKKLKVRQAPTHQEVIDYLDKFRKLYPYGTVYIEGGSRSRTGITPDTKKLLQIMTEKYPTREIIYGGGVNLQDLENINIPGLEQVIVSHMIHQNPDTINSLVQRTQNEQ